MNKRHYRLGRQMDYTRILAEIEREKKADVKFSSVLMDPKLPKGKQ